MRIVLILRADFQPVLQSIPGFHTRLNERLYLLLPLTPGQLRQVVERPAAARGVRFEQGLVEQILADAAGGSLPVLEFTLTKLWETQRHKTLTFNGYHQMGGVRGALNRFADEKTAQLTHTAAHLLDQVLLRLVRTPVGSANLATRQRVFQSEVSSAEWQVVRRLAEARLVTLGTESAGRGPYAELAHESLIAAGPRTTWLRKTPSSSTGSRGSGNGVRLKEIRCLRSGLPKRGAGSTSGQIASRTLLRRSLRPVKPLQRRDCVSCVMPVTAPRRSIVDLSLGRSATTRRPPKILFWPCSSQSRCLSAHPMHRRTGRSACVCVASEPQRSFRFPRKLKARRSTGRGSA